MGGKIVGGVFAASVKPLVQCGERHSCPSHLQADLFNMAERQSKYFGERHSWPSHLQADSEAACQRDTNLGTGGGQQPRQIRCQSPQGYYCPWPWSSRVFAGVLALLQARKDHYL